MKESFSKSFKEPVKTPWLPLQNKLGLGRIVAAAAHRLKARKRSLPVALGFRGFKTFLGLGFRGLRVYKGLGVLGLRVFWAFRIVTG